MKKNLDYINFREFDTNMVCVKSQLFSTTITLPLIKCNIRLPNLLTELALAKAQGTHKKTLKNYQNCELLIIDEWLLIPADTITQQDILEVLERRYRTHATISCSQFTKEGWHKRLGGGALTDAIMDQP
ncbi:ATP-binding protein [Carnobacterium mobile]|uniref:ATP-binding protein n=1 Tax=Carnobacterium mobile TaxID=2750 RepID=UPI0006899D62|nr:ATP-binding protein [Carnobacterium mobile]